MCMEFHIDFHLFSFRTLIWACAFLCENKRLRNAIHGLTFAWCYLHAFSSMFIYGHYVLMPRIFPHVTRMSWPFLLGPPSLTIPAGTWGCLQRDEEARMDGKCSFLGPVDMRVLIIYRHLRYIYI